MARVLPLNDAATDASAGVRPARGRADQPLYRTVCAALEALALAQPLADTSPLPAEGELMARFGVSRGTLRRAVDELTTEGLLRAEPGRGTFVVKGTQVRMTVGTELARVAVPDSRFGLELERFVPDFAGRQRCDEQLRARPEYRAARTVLVAPDNCLAALRRQALGDGKRVLVPTYGMRRGIVALDPASVDSVDHGLAATLDGLEQCGDTLDLAALRGVGSVDLIVTGAIAVTRSGTHFGPGNGLLDFEWALLRHCGLVGPSTALAAYAHECQVLTEAVPHREHDVSVDLVITPEQVIDCATRPKPDGILWAEILARPEPAGPYLEELLEEYPHVPGSPGRPRRGRAAR